MNTFTDEQRESLRTQAAEILERIGEGESTRDIMARIYVENLDDKTTRQGEVMADAIIESVRQFDSDYKDAREDIDRFLKKFQKEADKGKTCVERCNYWLKLDAAVSAAAAEMSDTGADRDKILAQIDRLSIPEEEATPERERALREQARETIKHSGILLTTLLGQAETLEAIAGADEAAALLIDLGNHEIEYREIIAMIAYTKIKKGEFENIPVDMTAAQVAAVVCAEAEQARIMEAVGSGNMAVETASALLAVLGIIVLARFAITVGTMGIFAASSMFGIIFAIPASLMIVAGLYHGFMKAADLWIEDSGKIIQTTAVIIRTLCDGIRAVFNYLADHVFSPKKPVEAQPVEAEPLELQPVETQPVVG